MTAIFSSFHDLHRYNTYNEAKHERQQLSTRDLDAHTNSFNSNCNKFEKLSGKKVDPNPCIESNTEETSLSRTSIRSEHRSGGSSLAICKSHSSTTGHDLLLIKRWTLWVKSVFSQAVRSPFQEQHLLNHPYLWYSHTWSHSSFPRHWGSPSHQPPERLSLIFGGI